MWVKARADPSLCEFPGTWRRYENPLASHPPLFTSPDVGVRIMCAIIVCVFFPLRGYSNYSIGKYAVVSFERLSESICSDVEGYTLRIIPIDANIVSIICNLHSGDFRDFKFSRYFDSITFKICKIRHRKSLVNKRKVKLRTWLHFLFTNEPSFIPTTTWTNILTINQLRTNSNATCTDL